MKASFNTQILFPAGITGAIEEQHKKNYDAYKKAQISGRETIKAVKESNYSGLVMVGIVLVLPVIVLIIGG